MTRPIRLIWAQADGGVIGNAGVMPWHLPEDLVHFRQLTLGDPVVMGRRTWDSLPPRFRPLPGRTNIVVTRDTSWVSEGAEAVHSMDSALGEAARRDGEATWVIGGAEIFALVLDRADRLEVTEIRETFAGDTVAPVLDDSWVVTNCDPASGWHTSRAGIAYRFLRYERTR